MENVCQSCGQPLSDANRGTEKDGSASPEYCNLCYENGAYKEPDATIEKMSERYVEAMRSKQVPDFVAQFFAKKQLPKLKRWNKDGTNPTSGQ